MIVSDALEVPPEKTKLLRLTAKELQEEYNCRTYHLRAEEDGLVTAEGEEVVYPFPEPYTLFVAAPEFNLGYNPETRQLFGLDRTMTRGPFNPPFNFFRYFDTRGYEMLFCATGSCVSQFIEGATTLIGGSPETTCAAVFHERIFAAKGERLFYCKALDGHYWSKERYGGGYIDLNTSGGGEIIHMLPYRDRLILMRRNGISTLRVLGDELNFKVLNLPARGGNLLSSGVAMCGDSIGYLTDRGFYLFNGATSAAAENSRCEEIDLSKPVRAIAYRGRFYALVTQKEGRNAIYCYNPDSKQAHFIENGAEQFDCGDALYFVRDRMVYRVSEQGLCQDFMPYFTAEHIAFSPGGDKRLRRIAIEGEGEFSVSITSKYGTRTVTGRAQEVLKLRSPLRGHGFDLKISAAGENADKVRFQAVSLQWTEENNDN